MANIVLECGSEIEDLRIIMNELSRIYPKVEVKIYDDSDSGIYAEWFVGNLWVRLNVIDTDKGGRKPVCVDVNTGEVLDF